MTLFFINKNKELIKKQMSRLTGSEAYKLMEAYSAVYASQEEVVEENIEQLDEMGQPAGNLPGGRTRSQQAAAAEKKMQANVQRAQAPTIRTGRGSSSSYQAVAADRSAGGQAAYKAGGGDAAARSGLTRQQIQQKGMAATRATTAKTSPQQNLKGLSIGPGGFNIGGKPVQSGMSPIFQRPGQPTSASTPRSKPATTPKVTPSATTPAKPAATPATAAKPSGFALAQRGIDLSKPSTTPAAPQRTFNPLMQRTFGYQTGNAPDQIAKASQGSSQATADAAFKRSRETVNKMRSTPTLSQSFDLFDVIKGHLLDEGYAETEEAAIAIMANMGEGWKQNILEKTREDLEHPTYRDARIRNTPKEGKPAYQGDKPGVDKITGLPVKGA